MAPCSRSAGTAAVALENSSWLQLQQTGYLLGDKFHGPIVNQSRMTVDCLPDKASCSNRLIKARRDLAATGLWGAWGCTTEPCFQGKSVDPHRNPAHCFCLRNHISDAGFDVHSFCPLCTESEPERDWWPACKTVTQHHQSCHSYLVGSGNASAVGSGVCSSFSSNRMSPWGCGLTVVHHDAVGSVSVIHPSRSDRWESGNGLQIWGAFWSGNSPSSVGNLQPKLQKFHISLSAGRECSHVSVWFLHSGLIWGELSL